VRQPDRCRSARTEAFDQCRPTGNRRAGMETGIRCKIGISGLQKGLTLPERPQPTR
jgi:hypothetical protein